MIATRQRVVSGGMIATSQRVVSGGKMERGSEQAAYEVAVGERGLVAGGDAEQVGEGVKRR